MGALAVAIVAVFSNRLIFWHSSLHAQVNEVLQGGSESAGAAREKVRAELDSGLGEWSLAIEEATVPDDAAYAGTSLHDLALPAKFGCSVVEIERNGFGILAPDSLSALYPGDRLLLLGKPDEIRAAHEFLSQTRASAMSKEGFSDAVLETCVVPVNGPYVDNTLANLQIARSTRVRIVGIRRGDTQLLNPTGTEALRAGDNLLLLGTPGRLRTFRTRLAGNP
jgi:CPA2 family monovalent cation:H+ antiporter-2